MNYTSSDVIKSFDSNAWSTLLFPTFSFFYIISWLVFLCYKHYGSAKSAHIFELNVLLDFSLFYGSFVWGSVLGVLSVDPGPRMCSLMMTPQHVTTICYYSAIAASHLETLLFLKVIFIPVKMTFLRLPIRCKINLNVSLFSSLLAREYSVRREQLSQAL